MGFLDSLLSKVGRSPEPASAGRGAARSGVLPFFAPATAPAGPLRLATGDFVTHYRQRFAVVGVRRIEGERGGAVHYCLRDEKGAAAVIVAEDGAEAALSMQLVVKADLDWSAEEIHGVAEQPFRLVAKGRAKARGWDDSGVPATAKSVDFRRYQDAEGDSVLVLEDYQGRREIRVGASVFEGELEIERTGEAAGRGPVAEIAGAEAFENVRPDRIVKGSPRAAAKALEENVGAKKAAAASAAKGDDPNPTAYDDDTWTDAADEPTVRKVARAKLAARSQTVEEEDEWVSATQLVRENGELGGDEDDYDDRHRGR